MQEPEIEDAVFEEIDESSNALEDDAVIDYSKKEPEANPTMSHDAMLKLIRNAVKEGHIDAASAQRARREMGIFNSSFTKKQPNKTKQNAKRKAQKAARKKNRKS